MQDSEPLLSQERDHPDFAHLKAHEPGQEEDPSHCEGRPRLEVRGTVPGVFLMIIYLIFIGPKNGGNRGRKARHEQGTINGAIWKQSLHIAILIY